MADDPRGLHSHFDALVGTQWLDDDPDHARVRIELRDELRQPVGLLHGGVMSTLVESICSRATALAVLTCGALPGGQTNCQPSAMHGCLACHAFSRWCGMFAPGKFSHAARKADLASLPKAWG